MKLSSVFRTVLVVGAVAGLAITLVVQAGGQAAHRQIDKFPRHPNLGAAGAYAAPAQVDQAKQVEQVEQVEQVDEFPNPTNTGASGPLGEYTGPCEIRTPNVVIENVRINCAISAYAPGLQLRNVEVRPEPDDFWGVNNSWTGNEGAPMVLDHVTIQPKGGACNPGASAIGDQNWHANAVKIIDFGDGFRYSGNNSVAEHSYVKLCAPAESDAHSDGAQGYLAGTGNVLRHNTIDQRCVDNTGDPDHLACSTTANIFWADESGDGLIVEDNLFMGGGFTIRVHDGSGHTVHGNRVVDGTWDFGPVSSSCGVIDWIDNRLVTIDADYSITADLGVLDCAD